MRQTDETTAARARWESWRAEREVNSFDSDPFLQRLLQRHLGERYEAVEEHLRRVAQSAGPELGRLVQEAGRDENLPRLRGVDELGRATEEVVFHPAYHQVGAAFWKSGVLAELARSGNEVWTGALAYLLDQQGEAGHACPVACTAGAIRLIQKLGTEEQKRRYLPALLDWRYESRLHAAQFVTEVQGGSDVGSNACRAVPDGDVPGMWRLSGEKWFCSVADAGLFVVSARVEGGGEGTRGLGLFLVPRRVDGEINGFRIQRLKEKLGTRSMATAEIELDGALAEGMGPLEEGFKNLVGIVLDTSRVHNALAACGIMRRALAEGHAYATSRTAFGRPILEFPAVRGTLARMRLRAMVGLATTFAILAASDRLETGDGDEALTAYRRIAVMINKYWTAVAASANARDGIELLGGNGTIKDFSPLPRLYRDAIVVESWEGTHNTLCAQVVRDFAVRGLHRPWLEHLRRRVDALGSAVPAGFAERAEDLLREVEGRIGAMLEAGEEGAAAQMRFVVDRLCRLSDWVCLAGQLAWELREELEGDTGPALDLYALECLDGANPQDQPRLVELRHRLGATL